MAPRVSAFQWGTNAENTVYFGYPLYSVIPDREPRAGSEWAQAVGAVEDSWITGWDYTLTCEARWLPAVPNFYGSQAPNALQTQLSGATGVQGFLDWARAKNTFRFVPDVTLPLFYIDGCYLADPMRGGRGITASFDWSQQFTIRNPTYDLGLAVTRGLMFEYAPGADISPLGLNFTYSRSSAGYFLGNNGLWQSAASGVLRDRHYPLYPTPTKTSLCERTNTNVVLWCRDCTNAAWTKVGVTPALDQVGIDGAATSASSLLATGANGTCLQAITLASSARLQSAFVKRLVGSGTIQMTTDGGSTWTNITVTAAWTRVTIPVQTLANPSVGFRIVTSGDKIAVDFVQNEGGSVWQTPSSPILTTTVAIARSADSFMMPHPWVPQLSWFYFKWVEQGSAAMLGVAVRRFMIGSGDFVAPSFLIFNNIGSGYAVMYEDGSANPQAQPSGGEPSVGDVVEFMGIIGGTPSAPTVQGRRVVNGGAETVATSAAGLALPAAWSGQVAALNSSADGTSSVGAAGEVVAKGGPGNTVNTIPLARAA